MGRILRSNPQERRHEPRANMLQADQAHASHARIVRDLRLKRLRQNSRQRPWVDSKIDQNSAVDRAPDYWNPHGKSFATILGEQSTFVQTAIPLVS